MSTMADENCASAVIVSTATTQTSSVSISSSQVDGVSKGGLTSSSTSVAGGSGGGLMCVVGQDGQTLILSDSEGRENIISGVTPDILQQVSRILITQSWVVSVE